MNELAILIFNNFFPKTLKIDSKKIEELKTKVMLNNLKFVKYCKDSNRLFV